MPPLCDFEEWIDTEMTESDIVHVTLNKQWDEDDRKRRQDKPEELKAERLRREEHETRERALEALKRAEREAERERKRERARRAKEADPEAIRKGKWPRCTQ